MKSEDDAQAALQCLCDWVSTCLDNDIIQSHPPPVNYGSCDYRMT